MTFRGRIPAESRRELLELVVSNPRLPVNHAAVMVGNMSGASAREFVKAQFPEFYPRGTTPPEIVAAIRRAGLSKNKPTVVEMAVRYVVSESTVRHYLGPTNARAPRRAPVAEHNVRLDWNRKGALNELRVDLVIRTFVRTKSVEASANAGEVTWRKARSVVDPTNTTDRLRYLRTSAPELDGFRRVATKTGPLFVRRKFHLNKFMAARLETAWLRGREGTRYLSMARGMMQAQLSDSAPL